MELITPILAQANPDPKAFYQFWLIIGFIASIASNVVVVILALVNRKQKREVSFGFVPASKDEFDKKTAELDAEDTRLHQRIGGVERGTNGNTDKQVSDLRKEVIGIGQSVASLQTATTMQNGELTEMKRDIKTLLQRK